MTDPVPISALGGWFPHLSRAEFIPTLAKPANVRCRGCQRLRPHPQSFRLPGRSGSEPDAVADVCNSCSTGHRGQPRNHVPRGSEVIAGVPASMVERPTGVGR